MKTGVVIVTYNRIELLKECLQCVLCQDLPFDKAVIVDNASTDGTGEFLDGIRKLWHDNPAAPDLIIRHEKKNLGGAGGFFFGLTEARKYKLDYVLIIDDDAMISPDYMSKIVECGQAHPDVYGFAGKVVTDGAIDESHRRVITSKLLFTEGPISAERYNNRDPEYTFRCDCATFCGLVIKQEAFQMFGLPKKDYFIWYDDSEYCLRFKKHGGILVLPSASLNHKTKLSKKTDSLLMRTSWRHYYGYRNRLDCGREHFGNLCAWCIALEYRVLSLLSRLYLLSSDQDKKAKGQFNIKMINDVLCDAKEGKLGVRREYQP